MRNINWYFVVGKYLDLQKMKVLLTGGNLLCLPFRPKDTSAGRSLTFLQNLTSAYPESRFPFTFGPKRSHKILTNAVSFIAGSHQSEFHPVSFCSWLVADLFQRILLPLPILVLCHQAISTKIEKKLQSIY